MGSEMLVAMLGEIPLAAFAPDYYLLWKVCRFPISTGAAFSIPFIKLVGPPRGDFAASDARSVQIWSPVSITKHNILFAVESFTH
jgi:hypothetical protein